MITIRRAADRGYFDHGWLKTFHTFSFAGYRDPQHMGFRALRVMNEDRVAPGQGFGEHGHSDMEIVTYVLDGALAHRDSLGNGEVLLPGEFQRMTAGTGIRHSEFNPSRDEAAHFYQIWLLPREKGLTPGYEQKSFPIEERRGKLRLVASPDGDAGSLTIQQDTRIYLSSLSNGETIQYEFNQDRHGWLQVLRGQVRLNDTDLQAGDGAAVSSELRIDVAATSDAEILLFDLV
jgi:redox-sensitive bicupin YhaK (pirin superfamily)